MRKECSKGMERKKISVNNAKNSKVLERSLEFL